MSTLLVDKDYLSQEQPITRTISFINSQPIHMKGNIALMITKLQLKDECQ